MAEEVKAEAVKEPTPSATPEVDILMDNSAQDAPSDLGGLFSDEPKLSETNLQGHEEESAKPSQEKDKPATPEPTDEAKKAEEAKKEEEKKKTDEAAKLAEAEKAKTEEAAKKAAEESGKPPEGYVPKQALAEARGQIKALKVENDALKAQKPPEQAAPATDEDARWKDFKALSIEEYDQMVDDDPTAAVKYDRKLREYEKYQDRKERQESEAKQQNVKLKGLIDKSMEEIDQVIPGIYDDEKGPEIRRTLAAFAMENGFENADYLAVLTNPETRVVPPGADQSYLVGPGAKGIIKFLNTLRGKLASADPQKLRDEITKEIEPKLREIITKELISKFKGTGKEAFKSLTDVPGSGENPDAPGKVLTEDAWAKLPESEREKLLGG